MNDAQIWATIGVLAAALFGTITVTTTVLMRTITVQITGVGNVIEGLRAEMNARFDTVHARLDGLDRDVQALTVRVLGRE